MMNTDYLIHLVKTYFSTVFFLWVVVNILLRLLVTKKKKKKKKKKNKGKKGGGFFYDILCWIVWILFFGHEMDGCWWVNPYINESNLRLKKKNQDDGSMQKAMMDILL